MSFHRIRTSARSKALQAGISALGLMLGVAFGAGSASAQEVIVGLVTKTEVNPFFAKMRQAAESRAKEKGDAPFLWAKRGGEWRSVTWKEAARQVDVFAESLKRIGLEPGDRVMLVSENRPEWLIADLGIMAAGCVTVPAYTTNTTRDHTHILGNSGAKAVIVSNQKLAKMRQNSERMGTPQIAKPGSGSRAG